MKKITLLFSFILLVSLSFNSCNDPAPEDLGQESLKPEKLEVTYECNTFDGDIPPYCEEPAVCDLTAGSDSQYAGTVTVGNDEDYLYVTVYSVDGYQQTEENIKMWVGVDMDDITSGDPPSRPSAGHFPCKVTMGENDYTHTFAVKLADIEGWSADDPECGTKLYVAVHADVLVGTTGETAWGGCTEYDGQGAWWWYFEYEPVCCEDEEDGCWCGFGFNYQEPDNSRCLSMMFNEVDYKFWVNYFNFGSLYGNGVDVEPYTVSLLANPSDCEPQGTDGAVLHSRVDGRPLASEVGKVDFKVYMIDGERFVDVTFTLKDKLSIFNIQTDVYLGVDQIPDYDLEAQTIDTSGANKLYQKILDEGTVVWTFMKLPWPETESGDAYMAFHAAIGDCPMPDLQNMGDH